MVGLGAGGVSEASLLLVDVRAADAMDSSCDDALVGVVAAAVNDASAGDVDGATAGGFSFAAEVRFVMAIASVLMDSQWM